jgi:DNA-binding transcriptional LysR family regulator
MIIDQINLNHLRVFECVYRTKSMTAAANELHLTQSGVSQHIKALEESLDIKLFDRINLKLVPTLAAKTLHEHTDASLSQIENALWEIKGREVEFSGTVTIGMPPEFGYNIVMPLMSKFAQNHPLLKFDLRIGLTGNISSLLLNGELDFAFIDAYSLEKGIKTEKVYDEVLELCIHPELMPSKSSKMDKKFFESLPYVAYQEGEPVLRMWFAHHLKHRNLRLDVRSIISNTNGVGRCVANGFGAGVIPRHLISRIKKAGGKLHVFPGSGRTLTNTISIAYLHGRTQSQASQALMEELKETLTSINK